MFCARLFICALWSPAGKGLTSWLSFVVSTVSVSLSHWYPGSGVVLDCIDSWSLHTYLLYIKKKKRSISEQIEKCWIERDPEQTETGPHILCYHFIKLFDKTGTMEVQCDAWKGPNQTVHCAVWPGPWPPSNTFFRSHEKKRQTRHYLAFFSISSVSSLFADIPAE